MNTKPSVGKTLWGCILPLIIFIGVDTVISAVAMMGFSFWEGFKAGPSMMDSENFMEIYNEILTNSMNFFMKYAMFFTALRCAIIIPIYFVMMSKEKKKDMLTGNFVKYEKFNKLWLLLIIPIGIFSCIGFNNVVMMIAELAQDFIDYIIDLLDLDFNYDIFGAFNETSEMIYSGGLVMQIISTCIGAPLAEELLFRGLIYRRLRKIMTITPAMLISSLIFGIIHGNIIQAIYAFLIGMICAYIYEKFKNIWAPIILHATANTFAVISTYFAGVTEGVGLNLGAYMLYTVLMIAGTFGLLFLLEKKFDRKEAL